MTNVFGEMVYRYDGKICFNWGWMTEDILMTIVTLIKFKDCYKVVIQSLTDWSNWTGKYANIIDKCSDSTAESITLWTWNPIPTDTTNYWYGDSAYSICTPGKLLAPAVHKMLETVTSAFHEKS